MQFKDRAGHDLDMKAKQKALSAGVQSTMALNQVSLPGNPQQYISRYQLDIIAMALEGQLVQLNGITAEPENKFPINMEFALAMEGARAGMFVYQSLGIDI